MSNNLFMQKSLLFIFFAGSLALGTFPQPAMAVQEETGIKPQPILETEIPDGWSSESLFVLRCPAPPDWLDGYGWRCISIKKGNNLKYHLDVPYGRVNDILVDEKRQLAVVSLQLDRANIAIYVVSSNPKDWKVWAVNQEALNKVVEEHSPKEDPQDRYAFSPDQLVGLRQKGNTVEGLLRHTSGLNPEDHGLSMLIYFSIDLDAPKPAAGALWPMTVTKVEDSIQEREWKPGARDFNPPLLPSEKK